MMVKIKLVGCQFHPASAKCIENEVVRVIRDPDNKFDPEAIKVVKGLGELNRFLVVIVRTGVSTINN